VPAGVPTVTFGGVAATGVKVAGPNWITGYIPANPAGVCSVDVTVKWGASTLNLPQAFCYLPPRGTPVKPAPAAAPPAAPAA
jgi:hypothetical protein